MATGQELQLLLKKSSSFSQLKQIHGRLLTSASQQSPAIAALLVRRATELGSMEYAGRLFASFRETPHVLLYNAMIRGYAYHGPHENALGLFEEMPHRGLAPDGYTYPYVVDACTRLRLPFRGMALHCRVVKEGFDGVPSVGSSLLSFYVSCGSIGDARVVFDAFAVKSVGLWNRMISEYVSLGDVGSAGRLFDTMPEKDIVSWNSMLSAYVREKDIKNAKELFASMPTRDVVSWTTMLRALADAGYISGMRRLFDKMPERNLVSWNCMLSSYTRHGRFRQALDLFPRMLLEGLVPDSFTIVAILSACEHLGKLKLGKWIHFNLVTHAIQSRAEVGTALVEMYAKCGDMDRALIIFVKMDKKDVFCWNVMIRAFAAHERADEAFRLFALMTKGGLLPNDFTFMGILLACSHAKRVDQGRRIFDVMQKDYNIRPKLEHYGCLIDLLCRSDHVDEAVQVTKEMAYTPDVRIWGALLAGRQFQDGLGSAEAATGSVTQLET